MTDVYAYWREALAHPHKIGKELAVHETEPKAGYYRLRNRDGGSDIPCAIWLHEGELVAMRGSSQIDPYTIWTWVSRSPVSYEVYTQARETGRWPDDAPELPVAPPSPGMGHNLPEDPLERMKLQLEAESEQAAIFLKTPIASQEEADKAGVWAKRVYDLFKEADDAFTAEKAPILKAAKACDDKWRWRGYAKDLAAKLKKHVEPWLIKKKMEEEERQRKAREEAERISREAEAKARAAELEAARSSEDAERAKREAEEAQERAAAAAREAEARKTGAGRTGAKVSLRTYTSGQITDYDAFLMAVKDRQEVRELLESLANRAAKSGVELPGMKIVTEQRAA